MRLNKKNRTDPKSKIERGRGYKVFQGWEFKGLIKEICDIVDGPVSAEMDIGLDKFLADWKKLG